MPSFHRHVSQIVRAMMGSVMDVYAGIVDHSQKIVGPTGGCGMRLTTAG